MKKPDWNINDCLKCDHFKWYKDFIGKIFCDKLKRIIYDAKIPKDCPLEDVDE